MTAPGHRFLGRREAPRAEADDSLGAADAEQRRLAATVARLRLELARLRGELDDEAGPLPVGAARYGTGIAEVDDLEVEDASDPAAEAEGRALDAEHRVRLLVEELGAERRELDVLRARLAEERESRIMLETLRDGLEKALEEQRKRYEREVTDVQEAAEDRCNEQTQAYLEEAERLREELDSARAAQTGLQGRLDSEAGARSRAENRARQLDREVDELRTWISAAERRRRGLRIPGRSRMPRPPGPFPPGT